MSNTPTSSVRATNKLIPDLRFPEFENGGEWKKKYFEELFKIGNGRDYKHLDKGEIPVYGSGGYMLSVNEFLYNGESVCIGRKGTIDKPMFLQGKFWTVDTLFYTHSFNDCLPKYIYYVFLNIDWLKHNEAGGVPSLSKTNIYKIENLIPNAQEQQKIASCLSSLDDLIAAHNEKLEILKDHKKGLMQNLFPHPSTGSGSGAVAEPVEAKVPRYRFPEFENDGEWGEKKLGDWVDFVMGNAFKSEDFVEDGLQLIRMGNLYQGELQLNRSPVFLPKNFEKEYSSFLVRPKDLLMSMTGTMGKKDYGFVIEIPVNCPNLLLNQRVLKITPKKTCTKGFVLQQLKNETFLQKLYSIPGGTKQANISTKDLKEIKVFFPSLNEQQKIASCFSALDEIITAQTVKIVQLQQHKKGLMQGLFPKIKD